MKSQGYWSPLRPPSSRAGPGTKTPNTQPSVLCIMILLVLSSPSWHLPVPGFFPMYHPRKLMFSSLSKLFASRVTVFADTSSNYNLSVDVFPMTCILWKRSLRPFCLCFYKQPVLSFPPPGLCLLVRTPHYILLNFPHLSQQVYTACY